MGVKGGKNPKCGGRTSESRSNTGRMGPQRGGGEGTLVELWNTTVMKCRGDDRKKTQGEHSPKRLGLKLLAGSVCIHIVGSPLIYSGDAPREYSA